MIREDQIIHGDCRQIFPDVPDSLAKIVITSPPYRAGKAYEESMSVEEYRQFAESWVSRIPRIVDDNGSFWLNVGYTKIGKNETLPLTYLYYPLVKMRLVQEIVWHYEGGMSYKKRFTHRTERWMWFAKNPDNVIFNLDDIRDISLNKTDDKRNHPLGKNPSDYWSFNRVVSGTGKTKEKTSHPCQFPISMIKRIIRSCSNTGDLIIDPFSGSGTVCAAAKELGRKYIGIEQCQQYVDESRERLRNISG